MYEMRSVMYEIAITSKLIGAKSLEFSPESVAIGTLANPDYKWSLWLHRGGR